MFYSLNKCFVIILLCAVIYISCDIRDLRPFADFRPVEISIEPDKTGALLPEKYSPVKLTFNTKMIKNEAEGLLMISSDSGAVRGDRFWEDNTLFFTPIGGWTEGIRYSLNLSGIVNSLDGRELRLERYISFFAVNSSEPPLLEQYSPADGASIKAADAALEFHFSCPMDRLSVESAVNIDGIINKTFIWSNGDKTLKVIPDKPPAPWISCRWSIKDTAKSSEGVPLPKTYSAQFYTDSDKTLPEVVKVFPVLNSGGLWYPTGLNIETGLGYGHGAAVEFNKPMGENVLRSLRFEPGLSGRTELLTNKSIVYIFSNNPEPDAVYTLIVSGDTRDTEGLRIGDDYRIKFIPDIPVLRILSVTAGNNNANISNFSSAANVLNVFAGSVTGELSFTFNFSLPFISEDKKGTPFRISLTPVFPNFLPPAALKEVRWVSDDLLQMCWENLQNGSSNEPYYYKLTIPGGRGGIKSDEGVYMKDEITVYLEVSE